MSEPITNPARLEDETNFPGLGERLGELGLRAEHRFRQGQSAQWITDNASATQAAIDAFDPVPFAKKYKREAIRVDGLTRVQAVFPAIRDVDELRLVTNIMQSIAPAARQLTPDMTTLSAIYTAVQNALTAVNNATTVAQVRAVSPNWP